MLRTRMKRLAAAEARAVKMLAAIETSIQALENEDLLDLADIFSEARGGPLRELAAAEMARRNISL